MFSIIFYCLVCSASIEAFEEQEAEFYIAQDISPVWNLSPVNEDGDLLLRYKHTDS